MRYTNVRDRGPFEEPPVVDKASVITTSDAKSVVKAVAWVVAVFIGITLIGERKAVVSVVSEWVQDMLSW